MEEFPPRVLHLPQFSCLVQWWSRLLCTVCVCVCACVCVRVHVCQRMSMYMVTYVMLVSKSPNATLPPKACAHSLSNPGPQSAVWVMLSPIDNIPSSNVNITNTTVLHLPQASLNSGPPVLSLTCVFPTGSCCLHPIWIKIRSEMHVHGICLGLANVFKKRLISF